ncbi:MAG: indole-3-glycerol-phosphate synthase [Pseudomonadota bacterium]
MSDFLVNMAQASRARAAELPERVKAPAHTPIAFPDDPFAVIAEIKRVSPAEGELGSRDDIAVRAQRYVDGGAAAISVLTEPSRFGGSLADLEAIATALPTTPVMRKDFLTDARQLDEACSARASGVLLIAAMLDDETLRALTLGAIERSLFVLLEAFDADDIARLITLRNVPTIEAAISNRQVLYGVNSRDLRTLAVDPTRLNTLAALLPTDVVTIAESGIKTPDDAIDAKAAGYQGALIGTALMRAADPTQLLQALRSAALETGP